MVPCCTSLAGKKPLVFSSHVHPERGGLVSYSSVPPRGLALTPKDTLSVIEQLVWIPSPVYYLASKTKSSVLTVSVLKPRHIPVVW